jgi:hypothetical protein
MEDTRNAAGTVLCIDVHGGANIRPVAIAGSKT